MTQLTKVCLVVGAFLSVLLVGLMYDNTQTLARYPSHEDFSVVQTKDMAARSTDDLRHLSIIAEQWQARADSADPTFDPCVAYRSYLATKDVDMAKVAFTVFSREARKGHVLGCGGKDGDMMDELKKALATP